MINVSENDNVTSQTQQHSRGKMRCVLRRLRKTGSDCADVVLVGVSVWIIQKFLLDFFGHLGPGQQSNDRIVGMTNLCELL